MNRNKLTYERPKTDLLVVRFEQSLLQASKFSSKGTELMSVDSEEDF